MIVFAELIIKALESNMIGKKNLCEIAYEKKKKVVPTVFSKRI